MDEKSKSMSTEGLYQPDGSPCTLVTAYQLGTHLSVVASAGDDVVVAVVVLGADEEAGRLQDDVGLRRVLHVEDVRLLRGVRVSRLELGRIMYNLKY